MLCKLFCKLFSQYNEYIFIFLDIIVQPHNGFIIFYYMDIYNLFNQYPIVRVEVISMFLDILNKHIMSNLSK